MLGFKVRERVLGLRLGSGLGWGGYGKIDDTLALPWDPKRSQPLRAHKLCLSRLP